MKKMVLALTLALALGVCGAAVAEQGVAYGVYSMDNEQPDSLIRDAGLRRRDGHRRAD